MWNQDKAGPYQAIPQPSASWQKEDKPTCQPHEYIRQGTVKLLTLFHPKSGHARGLPVEQATNAVLHPWLKQELNAILAALLEVSAEEERAGSPLGRLGFSASAFAEGKSPLMRLILIWDNLAGHYTLEMVDWCVQRGILLL